MPPEPDPSFLRHHPLGAPLPPSTHAVCCSLPTMRDVIGYEEKDPRVMDVVRSGYPRFVLHSHISALTQHTLSEHGLDGRLMYAVADTGAAEALAAYVRDGDPGLLDADGWQAVHVRDTPSVRDRARAFLQHTGCAVSSRQAEDALLRLGLLEHAQTEPRGPVDPAANVHACLHPLLPSPWLRTTNSGMNAFFAAFSAVQAVSRRRKRRIYLQLGWLYLDTQRVLERFLGPDETCITLLDVFDTAAIESVFQKHGGDIAAVITEVPNNPQIDTLDIARLNALCQRHGVIRIYDPSVAGCINLDVLPHTDILTVSLTKYAAHGGDVMIGALALNPDSVFFDDLAQALEGRYVPPYSRDLEQLARQIPAMPEVAARQNANTARLADYLGRHPAVRRIRWAYSPQSARAYRELARGPDNCGAIITVELSQDPARFYDRAAIVKGPSFGTRFTLMCPFLYLAHYDLVSSPSGRAHLKRHGMDPELMRISVGTEPFENIKAALSAALD